MFRIFRIPGIGHSELVSSFLEVGQSRPRACSVSCLRTGHGDSGKCPPWSMPEVMIAACSCRLAS